MSRSLEGLGLIGNCQVSALVSASGEVMWCCLPRFDAAPVFGALLDPAGGVFRIGRPDGAPGVQRYLDNTNVLETRFEGPDGSFRVVDFFPRFEQNGRTFRPTQLFRLVEPLSGTPQVSVEVAPVLGWSKAKPAKVFGSHHVQWQGYDAPLRLTTDAPLAWLEGQPFALTGPRHFVLAWGAPVEEDLAALCARFRTATEGYWRTWVKHCDVPPLWQDEVIRSALTLKLHCAEDTGAIVAALTTSLPEAPGGGRTWDYRYCWLRDAYYALDAFRLLGHFEEREQFLSFLLSLVGSAPDLALRPVYRLDGKSDLDESVLSHWAGWRGEGPVRLGNGAAMHQQHDVYGELVLALAPLFFDSRFRDQQTPAVLDLVTRLARKGVALAGTPDAGIWEYRTAWTPQTFSTLMCWAGADRMAEVARRHRPALEPEFREAAARLQRLVRETCVDGARQTLVTRPGTADVDASLLQALPLRFFPRADPLASGTIDAVMADLSIDGWLQRYRHDDGFAHHRVAFTICTFWLVQALVVAGRRDEAREVMTRACAVAPPLGLWSEDLDPRTGTLWGNYPQAYSHVGLIHAAFAAAPAWTELV
ncbi:MAG: glycoside hydrolase family 15 protein [Myxococcaceae bacterium]|jgi:GH15 family glucan-1,4-alpha-glucosidase|nr:glycoside hydrolase family 15 protein [Myxococcaceae bacterium]